MNPDIDLLLQRSICLARTIEAALLGMDRLDCEIHGRVSIVTGFLAEMLDEIDDRLPREGYAQRQNGRGAA